MAAKKSRDASESVGAYHHPTSRTNIPTEELRDFVADDEQAPQTLLYPRDTTLDPQLVWRGKDKQDTASLEVGSLPIYIQEKIHPQAIIEDLRAQSLSGDLPGQLDMFADFNGIAFEDLIDFYHHPQPWTNRMISGDSLLVMASLAEKENLKAQVQMIYLDPPYGIKFGSNWQVSTRKRQITDGRLADVSVEPEQIRAFRDTWEYGVHSYLAYLRDRLRVAQELLTDSGSIFVQINDEHVHLVRCLLDEVFGSENFVSMITFATTSGFESKELARGGDYIIWYGKNREAGTKVRSLFVDSQREVDSSGYRWMLFSDSSSRGLTAREIRGETPMPTNGRLYKPDNIISQGAAASDQTLRYKGVDYQPGLNSHWKARFPDGMRRLALAGRLHIAKNSLQYVRFADDFALKERNNIWTDTLTGQFTEDKIYVVQTNPKVIERCILMTTDPGDLVLDPTCGSGTTAYVAEQWGRRWITCDTSRVALALARTRLVSARFKYYLLADSKEGIQQEAKLLGQFPVDSPTESDLRKGFVCERVPHVTLGSISNNDEIDEICTRWAPELDSLLETLNEKLAQEWEEWQVPMKPDSSWSSDIQEVYSAWQIAKQSRQIDIDASIARHAAIELLHDRPYEDRKRVRVTGPFTVESLSPHRVVSTDNDVSSARTTLDEPPGQFETRIIENLKRAGVQNTKRNERLKFDRLDPYPGAWIQAVGEYIDADEKVRRVAVSIGPETGTVDPYQIKEAAKEAVQGIGFDLLIVCGFAFDPHVAEEGKRYGRLAVMVTRISPELMMPDDLLKKTGAGNLFMAFGEPDVTIRTLPQDKLVVELHGLDVYDPTTGVIRSNSTDSIACWFIDTNYNSESFFVRHAYFTGGGDPYEKLRRALRAEIDPTTWRSLYSTTSRPFAKPPTHRIAIKVINHYGDEVLKVFSV